MTVHWPINENVFMLSCLLIDNDICCNKRKSCLLFFMTGQLVLCCTLLEDSKSSYSLKNAICVCFEFPLTCQICMPVCTLV